MTLESLMFATVLCLLRAAALCWFLVTYGWLNLLPVIGSAHFNLYTHSPEDVGHLTDRVTFTLIETGDINLTGKLFLTIDCKSQ